VETREPADQHAAFNLLRAREGCAVDFDHRFPPAASTLALPHGGVTARIGTHAQGPSGEQPRQRLPCAWERQRGNLAGGGAVSRPRMEYERFSHPVRQLLDSERKPEKSPPE
jgi:hypothetical protein